MKHFKLSSSALKQLAPSHLALEEGGATAARQPRIEAEAPNHPKPLGIRTPYILTVVAWSLKMVHYTSFV